MPWNTEKFEFGNKDMGVKEMRNVAREWQKSDKKFLALGQAKNLKNIVSITDVDI